MAFGLREFNTEQAQVWRREYDEDQTLRVSDMAERHEENPYRMRKALIWAGGPLRTAAVTQTARRKAGLVT